MSLPDPDRVPRRRFLRAAVAVGGAGALAACLDRADGPGELSRPTGTDDPSTLPRRQHAWNETLDRDEDGNRRPPEHHVLLELSLSTDPSETAREQVEETLRSLERALERGPDGLLFTVGYTPAYFDRFDDPLPDGVDLPPPEPLTAIEPDDIDLDGFDALVHLASDHAPAVLAAEQALLGDRDTLNGREMDADFDGVFERAGRRTGFVGAPVTREQAEANDIGVDAEHIPENAPFLMGFRSGFRRSQATEDRVTIDEGPFAGGTTQHLESLRLRLEPWYEQDNQFQRVAKLFSAEHADDDLVGEYGERLGTDTLVTDDLAANTADDARTEGVVGHAQKAARAREDGDPLLLRRDFNTIDGDTPGQHFLSLQSGIEAFVRVRQAIAGTDLTGGAVGSRLNNGILQYIRVRSRGNYLLPPRDQRALPRPDPE